MAPRETENNAYAKFWGDKQRALWYVMEFSGVVNYNSDKHVHCVVKCCLRIDLKPVGEMTAKGIHRTRSLLQLGKII